VLPPAAPDLRREQVALAAQPRRIEQRLAPVPELRAQPLPDRDREPALRALEQGARHVALEELSQHPLAAPVAHVRRRGNLPCRLRHCRVEERHACLE